MLPMDTTARTRIALGIAARDLSDRSRAVVELAVQNHQPGALAASAAALRRDSLLVQDRAVLAELAAGAPWEVIADAIGLTPEDARARYETTYETWVAAGDTVGFLPSATSTSPHYGRVTDDNGPDAVDALDSWRARHTDPWEARTGREYQALLNQ